MRYIEYREIEERSAGVLVPIAARALVTLAGILAGHYIFPGRFGDPGDAGTGSSAG